MKKIDYKAKTQAELETELKDLRATLAKAVAKNAKNTKDYVVARKNIARVLTALNAMPAVISTESVK